ncbi:hypothetical protein ABHN11_29550 [Brevibacillus centrosporus]|uniref:hypothetical protein n=1 Tax=Brevibacillus centrosporus TaxID=54910 RepID=UPI003D1F715C
MVDSEKRVHGIMDLSLLTGGDFNMPPKKGQIFNRYDEDTKKALRLVENKALDQ